MGTKAIGIRAATALAMTLPLLTAAPARAADDTASTGILAALGIEAAGGDTKLGDKGGEIEGWMLATAHLDSVAREILSQVDASRIGGNAVSGRTIVLLARDEPFNLGLPGVISRRIALLQKRVDRYGGCPAAVSQRAALAGLPAITPADVAAVTRTDTTIAGFDIALEDRALISAIGHVNLGSGRDLRISSDATAVPVGTGIIARWDNLEAAISALRGCVAANDSAGKGLIAQFDALDAFVNTPGDKGGSSPLERAAAIGDLANNPPLLLRVAVEKAGGTTITRSNIFLKLGFPGAVRISGGIVASYRVIDPVNGSLVNAGLVRCALPQVDFKDVSKQTASAANCKP